MSERFVEAVRGIVTRDDWRRGELRFVAGTSLDKRGFGDVELLRDGKVVSGEIRAGETAGEYSLIQDDEGIEIGWGVLPVRSRSEAKRATRAFEEVLSRWKGSGSSIRNFYREAAEIADLKK